MTTAQPDDLLDALADMDTEHAALAYELLAEVLTEEPELAHPSALVCLHVFRDLGGVGKH